MLVLLAIVGAVLAAPARETPAPRAVWAQSADPTVVRLSSRCETGDDLACLRGAHHLLTIDPWEPDRWRHLRTVELERQPIERLVSRVGAVSAMCERGEAASCADLAFYLDLGAGLPHDAAAAVAMRARAERLATRSCARGDAFACRLAARIPDLHSP
jgi:hypothetical protein